MTSYLHPGVYVEEIPSGSKPIEGIATSIAVFIGYTKKGPLKDSTLISSWDQYEKSFGPRTDFVDPNSGLHDSMGNGVYAFFQNGGTTAYVVRLAVDDAASSDPDKRLQKAQACHPNNSASSEPFIEFAAVNEGTWANGLVVRISRRLLTLTSPPSPPRFDVQIGTITDVKIGSTTKQEFTQMERFTDVSFDEDDKRFLLSVINDGSALVSANIEGASAILLDQLENSLDQGSPPKEYIELTLSGGGNGVPSTSSTDYDDVFAALTKVSDINILILPGQYWAADGSGNPILSSAIAH